MKTTFLTFSFQKKFSAFRPIPAEGPFVLVKKAERISEGLHEHRLNVFFTFFMNFHSCIFRFTVLKYPRVYEINVKSLSQMNPCLNPTETKQNRFHYWG